MIICVLSSDIDIILFCLLLRKNKLKLRFNIVEFLFKFWIEMLRVNFWFVFIKWFFIYKMLL